MRSSHSSQSLCSVYDDHMATNTLNHVTSVLSTTQIPTRSCSLTSQRSALSSNENLASQCSILGDELIIQSSNSNDEIRPQTVIDESVSGWGTIDLEAQEMEPSKMSSESAFSPLPVPGKASYSTQRIFQWSTDVSCSTMRQKSPQEAVLTPQKSHPRSEIDELFDIPRKSSNLLGLREASFCTEELSRNVDINAGECCIKEEILAYPTHPEEDISLKSKSGEDNPKRDICVQPSASNIQPFATSSSLQNSALDASNCHLIHNSKMEHPTDEENKISERIPLIHDNSKEVEATVPSTLSIASTDLSVGIVGRETSIRCSPTTTEAVKYVDSRNLKPTRHVYPDMTQAPEIAQEVGNRHHRESCAGNSCAKEATIELISTNPTTRVKDIPKAHLSEHIQESAAIQLQSAPQIFLQQDDVCFELSDLSTVQVLLSGGIPVSMPYERAYFLREELMRRLSQPPSKGFSRNTCANRLNSKSFDQEIASLSQTNSTAEITLEKKSLPSVERHAPQNICQESEIAKTSRASLLRFWVDEKMKSPKVRFLPFGHILIQDTVNKHLQVKEIRHLLAENRATPLGGKYIKNLDQYPGPLNNATKTDDIIQYLRLIFPSYGPLQRYLLANLDQPLDWSAENQHRSFDEIFGKNAFTDHENEFRESMKNHNSDLDKEITPYLLQGKRQEAIEAALSGRNWAIALLIATLCDRDAYTRVISSFVEATLATSSPLTTLLLEGNALSPDISAPSIERWEDHIRILLVNMSQRSCVSTALVRWSDALQLHDKAEEAQICYLLAHKLDEPNYPLRKIALWGGTQKPNMWRSSYLNERSFFQTELFQFLRLRDATLNKSRVATPRAESHHSYSSFRFAHAIILNECGFTTQGRKILIQLQKEISFAGDLRRCQQNLSYLVQEQIQLLDTIQGTGHISKGNVISRWLWGRKDSHREFSESIRTLQPNLRSVSRLSEKKMSEIHESEQKDTFKIPTSGGRSWWPFKGNRTEEGPKEVFLPEDNEKPVYNALTGQWELKGYQSTAQEIEQERRARAGPPLPETVSITSTPEISLHSNLQITQPQDYSAFQSAAQSEAQLSYLINPSAIDAPSDSTHSAHNLVNRYVDLFNS